MITHIVLAVVRITALTAVAGGIVDRIIVTHVERKRKKKRMTSLNATKKKRMEMSTIPDALVSIIALGDGEMRMGDSLVIQIKMASHVIDEGTKHFVPELEDGFVGCFAGNASKGNVIVANGVDSNLGAVPLKKVIEMLEGFPLLVSGRDQLHHTGLLTGHALENRTGRRHLRSNSDASDHQQHGQSRLNSDASDQQQQQQLDDESFTIAHNTNEAERRRQQL